ncbi:MAG: SAF domain-containing protein, partial [Pirellulaceae bacterium]
VRTTEAALGNVNYQRTDRELASIVFRRSLFVVEDIQAGETITAKHVRSIRPGQGLPPKFLNQVIGRKASRDLVRGTPLTWDHVSDALRKAV